LQHPPAKFQGKEAEMFVSLARKFNKPNALNEVFEARLKDIDKNDYLALTTLYLQVFNPTRANGAEDLLAKYKGKEEIMFREYSSRWHTCNPVEKAKPVTPAAVAPNVAQNFTKSPGPNFVTEVKDKVVSKAVAADAETNDYQKLLTEFYQKHNPQKVSEIAKTLENYKVRAKPFVSLMFYFFPSSLPRHRCVETIGKRA
jgi:hypothetical protein